MKRLVILACLSIAPVAAAQQANRPRADIVVSAATSLSDVFQELASLWKLRSEERIVLNFAASNVLARQITAGARVDLFVSADETQMDLVAGHIEASSRVALLSNQLAIAVPDDRARRFASAKDLTDSTVQRIALGDPAAVPAGVYAKAYLQRLGLWDGIAAKVVPSGSARLALAAVENGAADAAIVFRTDIAATRRVYEAFVVPVAEGPRIVYPAAILRDGPNINGAKRFLAFLRSADATRVFERAGFLRP
jgi:molybdate transport system substrate-binding protein